MPRRSIGVAIAVPEPYCSQLQGWRAWLGDPAAGCIPPHVTLLPPTALPAATLDEAGTHLRAVAARHRPFRVRLQGAATFRPVTQVVFVPLSEGAAPCRDLQEQVRRGPLQRGLAFPYHPHVTVALDLDEDVLDKAMVSLADYEADFMVWGFTLFERDAHGVWRPQRDFAFSDQGLPGPQAG